MLVMASFNVNAQERDEAWLEYDNGVFMVDIGLLSGDPIYWGNMFTPNQCQCWCRQCRFLWNKCSFL